MPSPRKAPTMPRFKRLTVTMRLARKTRLFVMAGREEVIRANLGPVIANPRAVWTLLQGVSPCHQQAASVVSCADAEASSSATRMFDDDLVPGVKTVHGDVEVALRAHLQARQGRPIHGLGNNADLRPLCGEGVTP